MALKHQYNAYQTSVDCNIVTASFGVVVALRSIKFLYANHDEILISDLLVRNLFDKLSSYIRLETCCEEVIAIKKCFTLETHNSIRDPGLLCSTSINQSSRPHISCHLDHQFTGLETHSQVHSNMKAYIALNGRSTLSVNRTSLTLY